MNRFVRLFAALSICSLAACGGSDSQAQADKVTITLFQAASGSIEVGQSTQLLFAVDPSTATLTMSGGVGDVTGKTSVVVTPATTTAYQLTATKGKVSTNNSVTVTVGPRTATAFKVEPASTGTVAGQPLAVTVTAVDASGATVTGFTGTVHLKSSDSAATLPGDFSFAAADAGVKQVSVTLKTAGFASLNAIDTGNANRLGSSGVKVQPAAAASCVAAQESATSVAGSAVGLTVTVLDAFGNVATGYTGTMSLSSTDPRALLPSDSTFTAGDGGSHPFSAALLTTGNQAITATDVAAPAIQCHAAVGVTPAAPKIVLSVPANVNAGYPAAVGVTVKDLFNNALPGYAGTVTFTSTDAAAGAVTPTPLTFTGTEGGVGSTSITFVSLGAQVLTASDAGTPQAAGFAASAVHGLVYTAPNTGRVRLVANAAQSNTQIVQLDLVANERLEISSFFGGGPGSFAAGMNLPLAVSKVGGDTTLFTRGNALPAGAGSAASAGTIGSDGVLYTVVARKRVVGTVFTQVTEVQTNQVFYSVRLKLQPTATPGTVFDGAHPSPAFRASVIDQFGNDFVIQTEFGVGKLEVL